MVRIYSHLRQCLSDGLQYKLYAVTGGTASQLSEEQLVEEIKRLVVAKVNTAVHVKEFLEMRQDVFESFKVDKRVF